MFITFEGCEASGKSTQSQILSDSLRSAGYKTVLTKEPGGTELANDMRQILLKDEVDDAMTEFLLLSVARRDHVKLIKRQLSEGKIVISDRFSDSSLAYQGYAKGLDIEVIKNITHYITEGLVPDITFLLDVDLEDLRGRVKSSTKHDNFYDNKEIKFHEAVKFGFLKVAEMYKDRFVVINASSPRETVTKEIFDTILERHNIKLPLK